MSNSTQKSLEDRAMKLLSWKVTGQGPTPSPFTQCREITRLLDYLIGRGYVVEKGSDAKSLSYEITPDGLKQVLVYSLPANKF